MDAATWDERYAGTDRVWSAEPNRFVAAEVGPPPHAGATALDLACGEGRNAVWLPEQGWQVTGVDFSPVALDRARRVADARGVEVELVHADVTTWQPPEFFDLVICAYVQIPGEELAEVLGEAAATVADGGRLVAVGHHRDNLEHGHGGPSDASLLWDPAWIAARLGDLVIDRADRVERPVDTDEGVHVALDALVVAHRPGP